MNVHLLEQLGRPHGGLITYYPHALNGEREKQVGVPDGVMIEEVMRASTELIEIKSPVLHRDGQANLVLFVAFTSQREKALAGRRGRKNGGRNRVQWRRLIITAVSATQHPVQVRNLNGCAEARAGVAFTRQTGEVGHAYARIQAQP